jgi:hypothetical protein
MSKLKKGRKKWRNEGIWREERKKGRDKGRNEWRGGLNA